ncbi:glycoside hydrolase family 2 TIM barrel-domain containing protein [Flammeovirgaceae bacterium SG7u.111]|nr:glycoside hydrolase family 2 TIM barrel-domain containing protein [Flammeovirgaceae bacterium SG7u.132]WPO35733.1 glycoside hydrolase family 2 TIM barrel-domain containing protein [Flammeovirgaceae bacterium SG7u.111]
MTLKNFTIRTLHLLLAFIPLFSQAQNIIELNSGWACAPIGEVEASSGEMISKTSYNTANWMTATVPGTVLTTLLNNGKVPDPFYGMNNEKILDIYDTGRDHYTYWFVNDFETSAKGSEQVWLRFRGINYSCDVFVNGEKVNTKLHEGMFLRQNYNITPFLSKNGKNRLAVIVYPPDPVGNPNGGQGGDGTIAKNVSHQYVAGWDWIQPIRDRNTGIWDKVFIEKTGSVNIKNPHIITSVPGKRNPNKQQQAPATLKVATELQNPTNKDVEGTLHYELDGKTISLPVTIKAHQTTKVQLPDFTIENPKLWWPNMYGSQDLYNIELAFTDKKNSVSDKEAVQFGVREITRQWNDRTRSMQVMVNGQKIFIKGGNWIISDAMLRFTPERYDAEIRFHRDMNLNLIRIWGGALTERPEFYEACDKYGILVIQDFWISGDCNGKWVDPMKLEDQWTRRKYPDDHNLFLESARDMVKMIRNYPSLAIYCGGNEATPPVDILSALQDKILPEEDGTRWFIEYSNSDSMSLNTIGGNGDGPYTIQDKSLFWDHQTWPFNSEVGSVGVGDIQSLRRFIPEANLVPPTFNDSIVDSVWAYHKYIGYEYHVRPYGDAKDAEDFGEKAQLVNYDQYRALMEGFSSHMWDWYTGTIIWKTQNPWTSLRGQMYDYYLDPNACLYGLRKGSEPLHVMYNPTDGMVMAVNNTFETYPNMMLKVETIDMEGNKKRFTQVIVGIEPTSTKKFLSVKKFLEKQAKENGAFINFQLLDMEQNVLTENFYWVPNKNGEYNGLNSLKKAPLKATAKQLEEGKIEVTLTNSENSPVAFFNRISIVDKNTGKRMLPVFYDDNYVSVIGENTKKVIVEFDPEKFDSTSLKVSVKGWNVPLQLIDIQ